MKTHTPGPWIAIPTTAISRNPDSLRMDIVTKTGEWNPAFVAGDILPEDARLIASAPELLSALERLLESAECLKEDSDSAHGFHGEPESFKIARAAIAKAKGQQ
jgi:hypothetical protein